MGILQKHNSVIMKTILFMMSLVTSIAIAATTQFSPVNGEFASPAAQQSYVSSGDMDEMQKDSEQADAIELKLSEQYTARSTGCSVGCSVGCSTGCSTGCSMGCSVGCRS